MSLPKSIVAVVSVVVYALWIPQAGAQHFCGAPINANIRYVKPAASGNGSGNSWANASGNLQQMITNSNSAAADQVWVARGTYLPLGTDPSATFALKTGVKVLGGFSGTAGDCDAGDRNPNPATNGTVLSGDIGVAGDNSDNCNVVVTGNNLNAQTQLDGFTITGGNGGPGAGISIGFQSSPAVSNCRITRNVGGGIYCDSQAQPVISDCTLDHNSAASGAAIAFASSTQPTSPVVRRCRFESNMATDSGGAISHGQNGDANTGQFGTLFVQECVFIANESRGSGTSGGGAALLKTASHSQFRQCLFSRNRAFRAGGAIWCSNTIGGQGNPSDTTLINCTFSGNAGLFSLGGGLRIESQAVVTVRNSLLWGNSGTDTNLVDRQISYAAAPTVTYSSIQGCSGCFGAGNNGGDPKFVSAAADNLRAIPGSSAIDSADNCALDAGVSTDLDGTGHSRRINDSTADTGNDSCHNPATLTYLDRGAYEYQFVDCNSNGFSDNQDIANGAPDCNHDGVPDVCQVPPICSTCADCNRNGRADSCDIASGVSRDCNGDGVPDDCLAGSFRDCNGNCLNDASEINSSTDCNANGILDECEAASKKFTLNAEFDQGVLINTYHGATGQDADRLQRFSAAQTKPLPYIWVAASGRNTVVRLDTATGTVLGEYASAPNKHVSSSGGTLSVFGNPSRTTVDLDGSVWVANRDDNSQDGTPVGSIVKIGLVIGGTRTGQYLTPPFTYCTCEDRDGDGRIRTSAGIGDILAWDNWDGIDDNFGAGNDNGAIKRAEDECILRYSRVDPTGTRTIAVGKDNNIWIGGTGNFKHEKVDGFSALPVAGPFTFSSYGGYGGLIDCRGYLWSASAQNKLLRVNTANTADWRTFDTIAPGQGYWSYGLGLDTSANVWVTTFNGGLIYQIDSKTEPPTIVSPSPYATGGTNLEDRGVAVTPLNNDVWIAKSLASQVVRMDSTNFSVLTTYAMPGGNAYPTGVAVDQAGKVWVTNRDANNVVRIDPTLPPGSGNLVVDLNYSGQSAAPAPYNYGDMTGMVGLMGSGSGTWSVIHDSRAFDTAWCRATWNNESCPSTSADPNLEVTVRAANAQAGLASVVYSSPVSSGTSLSAVGRYLQVRVRFKGSCPGTTFATPYLCDLTVWPKCLKGDVNLDGKTDGKDIQPFVKRLLQGSSCAVAACQADINDDGAVTVADDIPCFANILLGDATCSTCRTQLTLATQSQTADCNANGIDDAADIANGTSKDCNNNFIPDLCDINPADPDGNGLVSADINGNGVPDECEPDCEHDGIPDSYQIAHGTRADINANGIPDICEPDCNHNGLPDNYDISQHSSADCNSNGTPDECEGDCNHNGVPDDCDLTSGYSPDCDADGFPDECELAYGPMIHVFDCNDNGVPDNCDIASGYSNDSNHNGIPDECESGGQSAAPVGGGGPSPYRTPSASTGLDGGGEPGGNSVDTAQGGSNENTGATPMPPDTNTGESPGPKDTDAAWEAFYEWADTQCWGLDCETTGSEQFQAYLDKLAQLGLPVVGP